VTNEAVAADNMLSHNNALEGDILILCDDLENWESCVEYSALRDND
jgi:hypothetical protein